VKADWVMLRKSAARAKDPLSITARISAIQSCRMDTPQHAGLAIYHAIHRFDFREL
jgi:hypothetical protein